MEVYALSKKNKVVVHDHSFVIYYGNEKKEYSYRDLVKVLYLKPEQRFFFLLLGLFSSTVEFHHRMVVYTKKHAADQHLIIGNFNARKVKEIVTVLNNKIER